MSELQGLNRQLKDYEELVAHRDMALKLQQNPDFRKLILDEFCIRDAARMISMSGDPSLDLQQRTDALAMGQAAGHLKRHLSAIIQMGNTAEREIPEIRQAIVDLDREPSPEDDRDEGGLQ